MVLALSKGFFVLVFLLSLGARRTLAHLKRQSLNVTLKPSKFKLKFTLTVVAITFYDWANFPLAS